MPPVRDRSYPLIIRSAKAAFRLLGQRFTLTGTEHIPRTGGALLAVNHIGYVDFVYAGLAAHPAGRLVRFMAKKEVFDHRIGGPVMRSMHHIPVDRADGLGSYRQAVSYLRSGELVGIFPEATISRAMELKEFKTGAVRIAADAGVPVLPVVLWGTQHLMTKDHPRDLSRGRHISIAVGAPQHPTGEDPEAETAQLKAAMSDLLDSVILATPESERPAGAWWVPARLGGGAPSLEEATRLDQEERRERARRKAEKGRSAD